MKRTEEEYLTLLGNSLYQPLEHPRLIDKQSQQPCLERWHYIQSIGLASSGMCIDIGCHTGWFCRKFSHLGWDTLGIDKKAFEIEVAQEFMQPFNGPIDPKYFEGDITLVDLPQADIVLCLSMVMYLFNPQFGKTTEQAWDTLHKISLAAPKMFLDYGGMYSTLDQSFPEDVLGHTAYTSKQLLGFTDLESRPFYLFERN